MFRRLLKLHAVGLEGQREKMDGLFPVNQEFQDALPLALIDGRLARVDQMADVGLVISYRHTGDDEASLAVDGVGERKTLFVVSCNLFGFRSAVATNQGTEHHEPSAFGIGIHTVDDILL